MKEIRSPSFYFLAFVLALLGALLVAAVLSPAIQELITPVKDAQLHRVFNRIAELGLFLGTWWLLRRLHLMDRGLLGYGVPLPVFLRRLAVGFLAGLAMMVVALVPLFALGLRTMHPGLPPPGEVLASQLPQAVLTGLSVALLEETYFRGAMQGAMTRRGAWRLGVFAVPAVYAAVHFLGERVRIPREEVDWASGFIVLRHFFGGLGDPAHIWDAFLALYFVGLLLALVRHRQGDIAACMGLHAGFVAIIALFRKTSVAADGGTAAFLVGPWDGLLGLWIATVSALACVVVALKLPARTTTGDAGQNGLSTTK